MNKCIKGESCLHCNTDYCRFKDEIAELKAECERLKAENKEYKRYKYLFEKAREMKIKTDKWAQKCLSENEYLKDSIKRTVCQAECYKHKEADKYRIALEYIRELLYQECKNKLCPTICSNCSLGEIKMKIDEVIGAEE